ncbi:conserved hypothetical protein [Talaromyces stipitatus ATCC 10500]|uniref:BHLH domain-containing protein n=1 Tax=Talaromyces stipitatus (strain ATCC 10500 / CBS 375.48 / QM 6759 / NRRL 1006) TaxID=441959 RepID=B8LZY5_TALSN|nr:uncharacterized protein TSTA_081500 [Talaromyces stipitatus ATCC 10500]EED20917.1 conserved hypothetical protein [Talaromyces stipitatus ATCC 10500]
MSAYFQFDLNNLNMANDDFLLYGDEANALSVNKTPTDQMNDLLWNFDYNNFAVDDTDGELFNNNVYNMSIEDNQIQSDSQWQQLLSSPASTSPSLTDGASPRSRSTSQVPDELPAVVTKPRTTKRKRSPVVNKEAHNKVEKRYRSNINAKFAALNDILPVSDAVQSLLDRQFGDEPAQQHRNKGEVLSEAMRYIKQLEERSRLLESEVQILKDNLLPRRRRVAPL